MVTIDPALGGEDTQVFQRLIDSGAVTPEAMTAILDSDSPEHQKLLDMVKSLLADEQIAQQSQPAVPVTTLTATRETLNRLGRLILRHLAEGTNYDPVQLLYIEANRAKVQAAREEIIASGNREGGVVEKVKRQLAEDADLFEKGKQIADKRGVGGDYPADGYIYHTGVPGYRFNEVGPS